ncbi:hypothetical protein PQR21_38165 [Paraburkholderia nemoris]|uniref:hypothetical protein n=1 Tax=Paraburkholderia nemoris TaxID=2793076 RepID=UPI0038B9B964
MYGDYDGPADDALDSHQEIQCAGCRLAFFLLNFSSILRDQLAREAKGSGLDANQSQYPGWVDDEFAIGGLRTAVSIQNHVH